MVDSRPLVIFYILGLLFSSYLPRIFDTRLFLILTAAFILATVIGTISHEAGHAIVAKCLGFQPRIHYASTSRGDSEVLDSLEDITEKYQKQLEEDSLFPEKERYDRLGQKLLNDGLWISLGGPVQTMLTGTIGLLLLFFRRRSFWHTQQLNVGQWALVFVTLFWLRQTTNLLLWVAGYFVTKEFSSRGDEIRLAIQLDLPFWSLTVITGFIGLLILSIVIFKFIPRLQRLTFILSGIMGGVAGYFLWLHWLGPVLLP